MTDAETYMLKAVWSEAHGRADEPVAMTEIPPEALVLASNGYIDLRQDGPDIKAGGLAPPV